MDALDFGPRKELLTLVRSLRQRLQLDGEAGRPLSYLTRPVDVPGRRGLAITAEATAPAGETGLNGLGSALEEVRKELGECRRCALHRTRRRLVFGEGNPKADLVFVGEAPGADEDAQGRPFVGRAGQLLTKIIEAMGLKREEVYICNILKCRPPGNRNPEPDEIASCEPFLIRQLAAIRPKVICALGTFSSHALLKSEAPISVLRGRFHSYQGIRLMPTYHPAYLLRNPGAKKLVWEDVQLIMKALRNGV
ncbi:MAG: uracil-DNA glycosylase [Deltaproteobacteria bacterium]|nr:uracil-DNA glycosylase [Deltaproteobacteria bacterium]